MLTPTNAPNVAINRTLPKMAPVLSMSAVLGRSMPTPSPPSLCDTSMLEGIDSVERNSTIERYKYTTSAAARNGRTTDEV